MANFGIGTLKAFTNESSLQEEARQAYEEQKREKKAGRNTAQPEVAAAPASPTAPTGEAKSPFPKPKRAAVWKSSSSAAPTADPPSAALTGTDISAMQASLQKAVAGSVRESLQATLHAELAEVKRQLRVAEDTAALDRKHAETRHSTLLLRLETNKELSDDAASAARRRRTPTRRRCTAR